MGGLVFRGDDRFPQRMAYYGDRLEPLTLQDPLQASGTVGFRHGVTDSTTLIGFFHHAESMRLNPTTKGPQKSSVPENFLGVAIEGPSREGFYFYPMYGTDREGSFGVCRGDDRPRIFPDGKSRRWALDYSPATTAGPAVIAVTLDGKSVRFPILPEHERVGARFDRFGIITTHIDGNRQEIYFDDLTYTIGPRPTKKP